MLITFEITYKNRTAQTERIRFTIARNRLRVIDPDYLAAKIGKAFDSKKRRLGPRNIHILSSISPKITAGLMIADGKANAFIKSLWETSKNDVTAQGGIVFPGKPYIPAVISARLSSCKPA